jgi:membrane protein YdbS with pleckstrin-like domain
VGVIRVVLMLMLRVLVVLVLVMVMTTTTTTSMMMMMMMMMTILMVTMIIMQVFVSSVLWAFEVPEDAFRLGRTRVFFRAGQLGSVQKILQVR